MQKLDETLGKALYIIKEEKLVASVTDGDIRRWILKRGNLDSTVQYIANYQPKWLLETEKHLAHEFLKKYNIKSIPLLNESHHVVSIFFADGAQDIDLSLKEVPVVIMAGGLGTRLYPYTKILPKALIPIGETPIIEHIIQRFVKHGCHKFYLIVNHKKNMIKAYFNEIEKNYELIFIDEDIPLGTGGGLSLIKDNIESPFILTNCDILIEEDYGKILEHHQKNQNFITMVTSLKNIHIPYGVIDFDEKGQIERMREKPSLSFFTNTGMYIVNPQVLKNIPQNKKIGFPDVIDSFRQQGESIGIYPISDYAWLDMGQIDELEEMRRRLGHE
jgi:dTDP-glucose pyrophosphorylase